MGVFRRKYRRDGKVRRSKDWSARFTFQGKLHRKGGFPDRESAQHWLDSTRLALRRGEVGYIKARGAAKISSAADMMPDLRGIGAQLDTDTRKG